ncbi:MAG: mutT/nudix family protein [Candidatus Taylorbacteria bacterium]|nr:mutT/nudix family protein [Candidatus Taylorbacteria bacterium]
MELNYSFTSKAGKAKSGTYYEVDSFDPYRHLIFFSAGAICFCGDKIVFVHAVKRGVWEMPGGKCEPGETLEETMIREIREESNMRVIAMKPLGYEKVAFESGTDRKPSVVAHQARFVAIVEPIGPFIADPDGDIDAIQLVDQKDFRAFFDWGQHGDAIAKKSLEFYSEFTSLR